MRPLLVILLWATSAYGSSFTHLYVVGDSLSDTGYGVQIGLSPLPDYCFEQGWSNGPLWPQQLMALFGKSFSPQDNKAVAGASTYPYPINWNGLLITRPGLVDQINALPIRDASQSLFIVWIGHNDLLRNLSFNSTDSAAYEFFSQFALDNIKQGIVRLHRRGARRIIVLSLFDFSTTKLIRDNQPDDILSISYQFWWFNVRLQQVVKQESTMFRDTKLRFADAGSFLNGTLNELPYPYGAGIEDPLWICCRDFDAGNAYGTWDDRHPTTLRYGELAQWLKGIISRMP